MSIDNNTHYALSLIDNNNDYETYLKRRYEYNYDYLKVIQSNGCFLQYIYCENQTEQMCMEAVKQNGYALRYVHQQTEQICMEAVKQNSNSLSHVKTQTEQLCIEAVKQDPFNFVHVINQTEQICLETVKRNGYHLKYCRIQTLNMCIEAVKSVLSPSLAYWQISSWLHKHQLNIHHLINYCISLKQLRLPSYVLMDIIDLALFKNKITHYIKINKVIKINETY